MHAGHAHGRGGRAARPRQHRGVNTVKNTPEAQALIRAAITQGVPGVPQDPLAPRRGPLRSSAYRERAIENVPALVPGLLAGL
jgi:hypothetical protein